jgi:hypothetical protein
MFTRYIYHPAVEAARQEIIQLLEEPTAPNLPRCKLLVGPTGVGKTELLKDIFSEPEFAMTQGPMGVVQPIIRVDAPEKGTTKSLTEQLLRQLQDRHPTRGTLPEMKHRLTCQLIGQQTKLIVIDEIHQLSRSNHYTFADYLKDLLNATDCALLGVGLADALELPRVNPQLARRCLPPIALKPFDWFDESADRPIFQSLLHTMKQEDPDRFKHLPIEQDALAAALHFASGGATGGVVQLLVGTLAEAKKRGAAPNLEDMAKAFDRLVLLWDHKPKFNPFRVTQLPEEWAPMPFEQGSTTGQSKRPGRGSRRS